MNLHPLLKQQFEGSRDEAGSPDLRKLLHAISDAYTEWDEERRGVVRSMRLLADETSAFTREIRESAAAQFQIILDHVKDAIITVDETGRIETLNATGERCGAPRSGRRAGTLAARDPPRRPGIGPQRPAPCSRAAAGPWRPGAVRRTARARGGASVGRLRSCEPRVSTIHASPGVTRTAKLAAYCLGHRRG